jgi:ABC-type transport system substrate-binding protein
MTTIVQTLVTTVGQTPTTIVQTVTTPQVTTVVQTVVTTPGPQVKNPNTLVVATIGDVESMDPAWAYDTASGEAIFNIYETLVFYKIDPNLLLCGLIVKSSVLAVFLWIGGLLMRGLLGVVSFF